MADFLIPMLFGWPMIALSLGFVLAGILLKRAVLSWTGAILFLPPAWYIGLYFTFSFILPLFLFASAYAVSKGKNIIACLLVFPALAPTGWLGFLVLTR